VLPIPLDVFPQAFTKVGGGAKAKFSLRPQYLEAASRLSVGLAEIPSDFTAEAAELGDHFNQFPYADLAARTDVYRVGLRVVLSRQDDRAGTIVDIQEFAGSSAATPHLDVVGARLYGIEALFDQRGNYVRSLQIE